MPSGRATTCRPSCRPPCRRHEALDRPRRELLRPAGRSAAAPGVGRHAAAAVRPAALARRAPRAAAGHPAHAAATACRPRRPGQHRGGPARHGAAHGAVAAPILRAAKERRRSACARTTTHTPPPPSSQNAPSSSSSPGKTMSVRWPHRSRGQRHCHPARVDAQARKLGQGGPEQRGDRHGEVGAVALDAAARLVQRAAAGTGRGSAAPPRGQCCDSSRRPGPQPGPHAGPRQGARCQRPNPPCHQNGSSQGAGSARSMRAPSCTITSGSAPAAGRA